MQSVAAGASYADKTAQGKNNEDKLNRSNLLLLFKEVFMQLNLKRRIFLQQK